MIKMTRPSIVLVLFAFALLLSTKPHEASRILHEEEEWMKKENLLLQSLQQGQVRPSRPNPPSYIPASRSKASTISQKGFAGHAMPQQHVYPQHMVPFGHVTKSKI